MAIPEIDRLGTRVETLWRDVDYNPKAFCELAVQALSEASLETELSPDRIVGWVFGGNELPHQPDPTAKFGQPPVTLFRGRRFYIDALFWTDGTTAIHQHAFSGAFQVLAGSSIETRFNFELERNIDGHFAIGKLNVAATAYLKRGAIRPINSGMGLIHSLFHLERPSVTVVIRTVYDAASGPQFDYARPGIGHDPFFVDLSRDRVLQLVTMLRVVEHQEFEKLVGDLIAQLDVHTGYRVLRECSNIPDRALFERLVSRIRDPALADQFQEAFRETRRLSFLQSRRNLVRDPDLRFCLGILLNAHKRSDAIELVREREPNVAPNRQVAVWLRQLSNVTVKLQAANTPWQPNLLGLPEFTDELETLLAQTLAGEPKATDEVGRAFLARLQALPALGCLFV